MYRKLNRMNRKKIYYLIIVFFALVSCQKDLDIFVPETGPDITWHNNISSTMPVAELKNSLLLNIQRDSFIMGTAPVSLTLPQLQLYFPSGCIHNPNGQPALGKVYVETYLLKKKGDMIRMGTPTTSNGRMLVSGGELFIKLRRDSGELFLAQGSTIHAIYNDPAASP